jgi:hypothetical protein
MLLDGTSDGGSAMIIASNIARILLGLLFGFAGIAGFVSGSPPPQPGIAGVVNNALYDSHWMWFIAFVQLLIAISFLTNRFVPVALIMLAAFLYNSFAYHLLTSPALLPIWFVVTVLWLIVALRYRGLFAPIFEARPATQEHSRGSALDASRSAQFE